MLWIRALYLLALAVWIGSIVFFSFVGAPSIFKSLPPEYAGKAVSAIFPKYYPLGTIAGFVVLFCLIFSTVKTGQWPILKILLIAVMLTINIYSSLMTHPRVRALKEEIQTATESTDLQHLQAEFEKAHRASVINNGTVLVLGLVLILVTARGLTL